MITAWVERSDTGLTVRLPDETPLPIGQIDVEIDGDRVVLTPSSKPYGIQLLELLERLGEFMELPDDPPPEPVQDL